MTTVVPTSEEDVAFSVVRFASELAWADAGPGVAEPEVSRLCMEAEEFIATGKWLELASLMITSAELIFSKVSKKAPLRDQRKKTPIKPELNILGHSTEDCESFKTEVKNLIACGKLDIQEEAGPSIVNNSIPNPGGRNEVNVVSAT